MILDVVWNPLKEQLIDILKIERKFKLIFLKLHHDEPNFEPLLNIVAKHGTHVKKLKISTNLSYTIDPEVFQEVLHILRFLEKLEVDNLIFKKVSRGNFYKVSRKACSEQISDLACLTTPYFTSPKRIALACSHSAFVIPDVIFKRSDLSFFSFIDKSQIKSLIILYCPNLQMWEQIFQILNHS